MDTDWHALFALTISPVELFVRGSVVYCFLFAIFRVVLRRDIGAMGIADVLLVVLVADAAQNAMAGEYQSISDGLVLVSTIVGWNVAIDWLAYSVPSLRGVFEARPLLLVRDGKLLRRNLRREWITEDDLRSQLREQGVARLSDVRAAYMESDGAVSVITKAAQPRQRKADRGSGFF